MNVRSVMIPEETGTRSTTRGAQIDTISMESIYAKSSRRLTIRTKDSRCWEFSRPIRPPRGMNGMNVTPHLGSMVVGH